MRGTWFQRRRGRRHARVVLASLVTLLIAWSAGLFWFIDQVPRRIEDRDTVTDAIVVLTGGAGRLGAGLDLLSRGLGAKLFISGVYRGVDVAEILRISRQTPQELDCCVELGHTAIDTRSNASETGAWMAAEGFSSLRLVTASYHMPRSEIEFRSIMPDARIIANPVFPSNVRIDNWWLWPGTSALLIGEYNKYLFAVIASTWTAPTRRLSP